ncbi:hypothetical protein UCRPC4_g03308 [Phaeomoniella chlamydospora]|uniref:Uncharacterized protein n=1 Tax=Phaeomoniella chlamydospora TaxID=158046 RepID=A0A0G2H0C9_PHACM|nr:hypothetical protein UCRPC4_g03308 [Phaeomoniella chlamydospora]
MPAPDLVDIKDLLRFWAKSSKPRLKAVPTYTSAKHFAKCFFSGFKVATGTVVDDDDIEEIHYVRPHETPPRMRANSIQWIRQTMIAEGLIVYARKEKYLFTLFDLTNTLGVFWGTLVTTSYRYRIQFQFIFPHVSLAVQRVPSGGWKLIYKLDQVWVKGNRDPENVAFGIASSGHPVLLFDETAPLIALALQDGALKHFKSIDALRKLKLKEGENFRKIEFCADVLNMPILRKVEYGRVTEGPMPLSAFLRILRLTTVDYSHVVTIHAIRRGLGQKVDGRYTEAQRSQILFQNDPDVFGQSYMGDVAPVNGRAAVLNEDPDHSFIEYFQGLQRFWEPGFPCELPAQELDLLELDEELMTKKLRKLTLDRDGGPLKDRKEAELDFNRCRIAKKREALERHQKDWLASDKREPTPTVNTDVMKVVCGVVPELARLSQTMLSNKAIGSDETWAAIGDMLSLLEQEVASRVQYLPGQAPIDGRCPVESCKVDMERRTGAVDTLLLDQNYQAKDADTTLGAPLDTPHVGPVCLPVIPPPIQPGMKSYLGCDLVAGSPTLSDIAEGSDLFETDTVRPSDLHQVDFLQDWAAEDRTQDSPVDLFAEYLSLPETLDAQSEEQVDGRAPNEVQVQESVAEEPAMAKRPRLRLNPPRTPAETHLKVTMKSKSRPGMGRSRRHGHRK